jgi:hypothetical protein
MRSNQLSTVIPALVVGIHVSLAELPQAKTRMAGISPAMTPEKWFNVTERPLTSPQLRSDDSGRGRRKQEIVRWI